MLIPRVTIVRLPLFDYPNHKFPLGILSGWVRFAVLINIGFVIAEVDRKAFRRTHSIVDRELDTVISLIAFAVMLFGVVDSLSMVDTEAIRYEKAKLVIIFVIMFTFTWFKSYAESLGVVKTV